MSESPALSVAVRLYGGELEPSEISSIVGMEPTHSGRRGQPAGSASGKVLLRTGLWCLEEAGSDAEIISLIDTLLKRFIGFKGSLTQLPNVEKAELSLFVGDDVSESLTWDEVQISPSAIAQMASLGLGLSMTYSLSLAQLTS